MWSQSFPGYLNDWIPRADASSHWTSRKNNVCNIAEININISTSPSLQRNQWKSMEIMKLTKWAMDGHGASCCFGRWFYKWSQMFIATPISALRNTRHGIHHLFHLEAHLHLGRNDFFWGLRIWWLPGIQALSTILYHIYIYIFLYVILYIMYYTKYNN